MIALWLSKIDFLFCQLNHSSCNSNILWIVMYDIYIDIDIELDLAFMAF